MNNETDLPQTVLLTYLNTYLSKKDLKMKQIMRSIKQRITNNETITPKQFNSIIKFVEREKEFRGTNRTQIFEFFKPLINKQRKKFKYEYDPLSIFT